MTRYQALLALLLIVATTDWLILHGRWQAVELLLVCVLVVLEIRDAARRSR